MARHRLENGGDDAGWFMPYAEPDPAWSQMIVTRVMDALPRSVGEPVWMRMWGLFEGDQIWGHVDITGGSLSSARHRAMVGIGLERQARRAGWGRRLAERGLAWAAKQSELDWIELRVFAGNAAALAMYSALGFQEVGRIEDAFRLGEQSVDDVLMRRAATTIATEAG